MNNPYQYHYCNVKLLNLKIKQSKGATDLIDEAIHNQFLRCNKLNINYLVQLWRMRKASVMSSKVLSLHISLRKVYESTKGEGPTKINNKAECKGIIGDKVALFDSVGKMTDWLRYNSKKMACGRSFVKAGGQWVLYCTFNERKKQTAEESV